MEEFFQPTEKIRSTIDIDAPEDMDVSETQWGWFYLAECGKWHMFETTSGSCCSISSQEIEQHYRMNPHGSITFKTMKFNYKLDFIQMNQTNLISGKQRPVKRAPFSISAFSYICDNGSIPLPPHWEHVTSHEPYQLIPLIKNCNEYNDVANLFGESLDRKRISEIRRIQNVDLWEFYCRKKALMKKKKGLAEIAEERLFHGTSNEFVGAICIHNFDWRINGIHGSVYGKGTYFAKNAAYSSQYCKKTGKHSPTLNLHGVATNSTMFFPKKSMFLARVLVGEYTLGDSKYIRPPSKDGSLTNLYDSCVDNPFSPLIYVVFDNNQVYPEYLIHFD